MPADAATPNVIIVGDAAAALNVSPDALESIGGDARVTRTVLRSEVLHAVRGEPLDLIIAVAAVALLATPEFLAAFRARASPVSLLILAKRPDEAALARLGAAGVQAECLAAPVGLAQLRERVRAVLAERALMATTTTTSPAAEVTEHQSPTTLEPQPIHRRNEHNMANINKTLEEAMKIDGAIGVALADWESGLCLGIAGGGSRLNLEVAAAGNCQVVKAKMATMSELGIKGAIQDILITLDDQIHLIRPIKRAENLFLYLAIDKVKGNLGMARHRVQKLEAELNL